MKSKKTKRLVVVFRSKDKYRVRAFGTHLFGIYEDNLPDILTPTCYYIAKSKLSAEELGKLVGEHAEGKDVLFISCLVGMPYFDKVTKIGVGLSSI